MVPSDNSKKTKSSFFHRTAFFLAFFGVLFAATSIPLFQIQSARAATTEEDSLTPEAAYIMIAVIVFFLLLYEKAINITPTPTPTTTPTPTETPTPTPTASLVS